MVCSHCHAELEQRLERRQLGDHACRVLVSVRAEDDRFGIGGKLVGHRLDQRLDGGLVVSHVQQQAPALECSRGQSLKACRPPG
eukprot:3521640-Pleurochrysis_carterae.AAC.2